MNNQTGETHLSALQSPTPTTPTHLMPTTLERTLPLQSQPLIAASYPSGFQPSQLRYTPTFNPQAPYPASHHLLSVAQQPEVYLQSENNQQTLLLQHHRHHSPRLKQVQQVSFVHQQQQEAASAQFEQRNARLLPPIQEGHFRARVASVSSTSSSPEASSLSSILTRSTSFSSSPTSCLAPSRAYADRQAAAELPSPPQYLQLSPQTPQVRMISGPGSSFATPSASGTQQQQFALSDAEYANLSRHQHQQLPSTSGRLQLVQANNHVRSSASSSAGSNSYSPSASNATISPSDALNLGINLEQYISKRNERERSRVKNVNDAFENLKNSLPLEVDKLSKRMSKVEILRTAISYIKNLEEFLKQQNQDQTPRLVIECSNNNALSSDISQQASKQGQSAGELTQAARMSISQLNSQSTNSKSLYQQQQLHHQTSCNENFQQSQFVDSSQSMQVLYQSTQEDSVMQFSNQTDYLNFAHQMETQIQSHQQSFGFSQASQPVDCNNFQLPSSSASIDNNDDYTLQT